MPRAPWVRRRTVDSPRPAGRRWAGRLRRSGSLARQVLTVRVGRHDRGLIAAGVGSGAVTPDRAGATLVGPGGSEFSTEPLTRIRTPASGAITTAVAEDARAALVAGTARVPDAALVSGAAPTAATAPLGPPAPVAGALPVPGSRLLPGDPSLARRLRFAAVNACSVGSLMLGMLAIFLSMHEDPRWAALCLVGCVTFDGMDGALARRLGVTSPFGAQMDSLADMCSFGIAAPVVVYASLHGSARGGLLAGACMLIAACSAIRLARFNVSPKNGRFFCGVPTTLVAAVLGLAVLIGLRPSGTVAVTGIVVLALAMVSGFPYAKLNRIVRLPPWLWLAPVAGALIDYQFTFGALVALYLASGPLLWLRRRG